MLEYNQDKGKGNSPKELKMIKVKAYFKNDIMEDKIDNKEVIADLIDYFAKCEKDFNKCEITYDDGSVETLVNSDFEA